MALSVDNPCHQHQILKVNVKLHLRDERKNGQTSLYPSVRCVCQVRPL